MSFSEELVAEQPLSAQRFATPEDRLAWVALVLSPGVGQIRALRAMKKLRQPRDLFVANLTEVEGLQLPAAAARFIAEGKAREAAQKEVDSVLDAGAEFLTHDDADYPERLREIYDPPAVLWYRGDVKNLALPGIAVVGTRNPSPYGQTMALMLSRDLAARGMAIFSGMARGVDIPGNVTNKNAWGPNTLIKQGARLTATWEDIWEDLPSEVRIKLEEKLAGGVASKGGGEASLFAEDAPQTGAPLSAVESEVFSRLRLDESVQLDELIEALEEKLPAPEIFNALFELEMAGRIRCLPGKNYVRAF